MTQRVPQYWEHAEAAINAARGTVQIDSATAANRAYYAAFYAVSALFAAEGKTFKRHAGVAAAVQRDLVNTGRWSKDIGTTYSQLATLRVAADYDIARFPSTEEAENAVRKAERILQAVRDTCSELD